MTFAELGLSPEVLKAVEELGYASPTPIQAKAIPVVLGGVHVTILPGVHIGSNVVVAAGAVVARDIPDNCVAAGVPAKKIRDLEQ